MKPVDVVAVLWTGHRGRGYTSTGGHSSFFTRGPEMVEKLARGISRYCPAAASFTVVTDHPSLPEGHRKGIFFDQYTIPLRMPEIATGWWSKMEAYRPDLPHHAQGRKLYIDLDNVLGPQVITPITELPLSCEAKGHPAAYMPDDRHIAGEHNGSLILFDEWAGHLIWDDFTKHAAERVRQYPATGPGTEGAGCDQPYVVKMFGGKDKVPLLQPLVPPGLIGHAKKDLADTPGFDHSNVGVMVGWWTIDPVERPDLRYYKEQWV